jgi:hypothetical protein
MALFTDPNTLSPVQRVAQTVGQSGDPYVNLGRALGLMGAVTFGGAQTTSPYEQEVAFMTEFSKDLDPNKKESWQELAQKASDYGLSSLSARLMEQAITLKPAKATAHKFVPEFNLDSEIRLLEAEAKKAGVSLEKFKQRDPAYSFLKDSADQAYNDALTEAAAEGKGGSWTQKRFGNLKEEYRNNIIENIKAGTPELGYTKPTSATPAAGFSSMSDEELREEIKKSLGR